MFEQRLLFVVNPFSGRAAIRYHLMDALRVFSERGYITTVCPTRGAGDATEIVERLGADYDRIAVSGGDGTVNEAVNGLMRLSRKIPFAIMPAGTTNDYAYTLGIPSELEAAAATAAGGELCDIDLGCFNGRYFTYVAAFGVFTEVSYETSQDLKNILGGAAYALEGARRALDVSNARLHVSHDGGELEDEFMLGLVSNTISVAGMRSALEGARLDDGRLEVTLVRPPKTLADIQTLINILLDFEHLTTADSPFLTHFSTTRVKIDGASEVRWTLDGENGGSHREVEIVNAHLAATMVIGSDARFKRIERGREPR